MSKKTLKSKDAYRRAVARLHRLQALPLSAPETEEIDALIEAIDAYEQREQKGLNDAQAEEDRSHG